MAFIADKRCMLLLFWGISLWMSLREASGRFVNLNSENCINFAYMQFWTIETIEIKGSKATSEHILHNDSKETAAKSPDEQHSKQLLSPESSLEKEVLERIQNSSRAERTWGAFKTVPELRRPESSLEKEVPEQRRRKHKGTCARPVPSRAIWLNRQQS